MWCPIFQLVQLSVERTAKGNIVVMGRMQLTGEQTSARGVLTHVLAQEISTLLTIHDWMADEWWNH